MQAKRWVLLPECDQAKVERLATEININPVLASLLVRRGIETFEQAKEFFRPSLSMLHDPFLMKDMDRATERIKHAVKSEEKILVYGDYDVDGTTAVSLIYMFLSGISSRVDYYIPDRYSEGYGVSFKSVDYAFENGFTLIIALDCGIKAADKVSYAKQKGIDFIICDHHLPGTHLPEAYAVLDPKRNDCQYPYKELTGCGIGFKLVQAYAQKNNIPFETVEQFIDLVAISIAGDIVPMTGENRVITYYGLKKINESPRLAVKSILGAARFYTEQKEVQKREVTVNDVVFLIAPRINAAGRIDSGRQAVELLTTGDPGTAALRSADINDHNVTRKELDQNITEQALALIAQDKKFIERKSTVVFSGEWHKGVIGIVASRLTERYYRPTIVLTESNGIVSGSARSVKDFDIHAAIEACADLLEQYGGHKYAAGLTLKKENIERFRNRFDEVVSASIPEHSLTPEIEIDAETRLSDFTFPFYKVMKQFAPFGPGNMSPVFLVKNVHDTGYGRIVGNNHLKFSLSHQPDSRGFDAIAFQQGHHFSLIEKKAPVDVCFHLEENSFNGRTSLQLNVKDMRKAE